MKNKLLFLLATLVLVTANLQNAAQAEEERGFAIYGQYERILPSQPTQIPDKVEVLEMFWYGCPHCFTLEPVMDEWLKDKPDYVNFRRAPAVFRQSWVPHAKAFLIAETLGVTDKVHGPLFTAIHKEKRPLNTRDQLATFFAEHGIEKKEFLLTYDSFSMASQVRRAQRMGMLYGIDGVPAVIINGKYRTSGGLAGSYKNMIKVINTLVDEEHRHIETMATTSDAKGQN